jgi:S-adenosylmethionine:tRNA ribosyltransferase-isomerase
MLVIHRESGTLEHRRVSAIGDYLRSGDLLVVNNTKVIPARIYGTKSETGGAVELLLLEPLGGDAWLALCRASHQPKPGMTLLLASGRIRAEVIRQGDAGRIEIKLTPDAPLFDVLDQEGDVPLPPYIHRDTGDARRASDVSRYQTVYASQPGAVAAPTAGLHFTTDLLAQLARAGIHKAEVTLHVGIGTFRPVSVDEVREHRMDDERYEVAATAAAAINATRAGGGRIAAVGSTSVRTLETMMQREGRIVEGRGRSDLFIYPPYEFRAVDVMLTNFHLPRSTLLMMVSAFAGMELTRHAYREAIRERYRFFSYGDCMLIL